MAERRVTSPRFIVKVNGEQRCIAGFDGYAVLSAGFSHVRRIGDVPEAHRAFIEGAVRLRVGGLQNQKHVEWLTEELFVGDEATITFRAGGPVDPSKPVDRQSCQARMRDEGSRLVEHRRKRLAEVGNQIPHRMEVSVNGERLCTAGVEAGVLDVHVTYTRRDPATKPPHESDLTGPDWEDGETDLRVGGLEDEVHLNWIQGSLDVGDEIAVRVLGRGPIDPPVQMPEFRPIPHADEAVLGGKRITLRKLIDVDGEFVTAILSDQDILRFCPSFAEPGVAQNWLRLQRERYQSDGCGIWVIVDGGTHDRVGLAGVIMTDFGGERLPVIHCAIDKALRRQGYGAEAAWSCMVYVEHLLKKPVAYGLVHAANEPALKLAHKMGMTRVRNVQHKGFEHVLFERRIQLE